jgi:HEPN domain-containing protein
MAESYNVWLERAASSLSLGLVKKTRTILYEDLCFQLQQAAEKALKAYLVFHEIDPPLTHSFVVLLQKVRQVSEYPEELNRAVELEDYAVETRYPGEYAPVDKKEYTRALEIAKYTVNWVHGQIK